MEEVRCPHCGARFIPTDSYYYFCVECTFSWHRFDSEAMVAFYLDGLNDKKNGRLEEPTVSELEAIEREDRAKKMLRGRGGLGKKRPQNPRRLW